MTPAQMAALHGNSFARGWSEGEITELLSKPTTLAVHTGAGFALVQLIAPDAEILTLVIDPALRGKGHGASLLTHALQAAEQNGAATVFLEVDATNTAARALYASAGFQQTGRRKAYYTHADGARSDALVLALALNPGT